MISLRRKIPFFEIESDARELLGTMSEKAE
jgi:hypothetical protein